MTYKQLKFTKFACWCFVAIVPLLLGWAAIEFNWATEPTKIAVFSCVVVGAIAAVLVDQFETAALAKEIRQEIRQELEQRLQPGKDDRSEL